MTTKTALRMADVVIDSLSLIQGLTQVGGDKAAKALETIDKVVSSLKDGVDGVASPQAVMCELDGLVASLADNDAAALAALRAKFGK